MKFQQFDGFSSSLVFFVAGGVGLVGAIMSYSTSTLLGGVKVSSIFCFDVLSFYFSLLSLFLGVSLLFFYDWVSGTSIFMVGASVLCSFLSYSCVHSLWFWVFYELSILPLLYLLVVESPYSERYVASWYLLGYVVLTSLPMLLCLYYLSLVAGSFFAGDWWVSGAPSWGVLLVLGVLFITKIPLPPFHVWLPIVHAEASSHVSVCLSGYIMKLGILGVCRFCSWCLPTYVFTSWYMVLGLSLATLFFFSACRELDGKRWLAFLSLSHIVIAALGLSIGGWDVFSLSFFYCLGHGLSAGSIFIFLWVTYEVGGSRNWGVLKFCLSSSLFFRCVSVAALCTAASLPPTIQFFCEVGILGESLPVSGVYGGLLCVYLFLGGLVPLFLVGSMLNRHYSIAFGSGHSFVGMISLLSLVVVSFVFFIIG